MGELVFRQAQQRSEDQQRARTRQKDGLQLGFADTGEALGQPGRHIVGSEEVFSLVERGFVDIGEVRGQVRHVQLAGHGRVNRAVVLGAVALRHKADLVDSLSECASSQDGLNSCFNSHRLIPPSR